MSERLQHGASRSALSALVEEVECTPFAERLEQKYSHILNMLEAEVYVMDAQSLRYLFINQSALEILGWEDVDYRDNTPEDDDPFFDPDKFRAMVAPLMSGEKQDLRFFRSLHDRPETEIRIQLLETGEGPPELLVIVRPPVSIKDHRAMIAPVTELSPIATSVVDSETGQILYANQTFRHKFEVPLDSLRYQTITLIFEELTPRRLREMSATLEENATGGLSFEVEKEDGRFYELRINRIQLTPERVDLAIIVQNISERVEREAERHAFLATISHELKTPLAAIIGSLSTIQNAGLTRDETLLRLSGLAKTNADRLAVLVEQILAKETAELNVHRPEVTDFQGFIAESVKLNRPHAESAGVTLEYQPGRQSAEVAIDPANLGRVIDNLITNAIRHGGAPGHVVVEARVKPRHACFWVKDEGRGINPDHLTEVFDWHFVGDSSDSRRVGGTGLGLAICQKIVKAHGGTIQARNRDRGGACFEVVIPLAETSPLKATP